jgi:hypothetical protein
MTGGRYSTRGKFPKFPNPCDGSLPDRDVTSVSHVVNSGVSHVVNSQLFNTDFNNIYTDFNIALVITQPTVVSGYFYSRLSIFLYCRPSAASALFTSGLEWHIGKLDFRLFLR